MLKNISPLVMSYRFEWCGEAFEEKLVSSPVVINSTITSF